MNRISSFAAILLSGLFVSLSTATAWADDADEKQSYSLRYTLTQGQKLHYEVTHMAKTKTRIQGTEDVSQVHTISHRHWDIGSVSDEKTVFDHIVDAVEMTQQGEDTEEVRWNSATGEPAPTLFSQVAKQIGTKLSTITINPRGQEKDREEFGPSSKSNLGMGSLTIAFPEEPIAVGDSWAIPREVKTRTEEGLVKTIKIRELYTLTKVKSGVATLSIRSEPLTPLDDESVRAQVIQQLSNGTIRFDLDAGHMLSKELSWDETVVGFQGPNSLMEYRARMTEKYLSTPPSIRTAKKPE